MKEQAKGLARIILSALWGNSFSILSGPLKRRRLPKAVALHNYQMLCGRYEPEVVSTLLSLLNPSTVSYDVGANIGYLTLVLAEGVNDGIIFAFEPVPENQALLQELIAANNLGTKVRVVPVALSNLECRQKMYIYHSPATSLLESALDGQNINEQQAIIVATTTLDAFVFEKHNPAPHILKIDVEGAEFLVLEGGLRTLKEFSPKLMIEIHGPQNAHKIWHLLKDSSYSWWHLAVQGGKSVSSEEILFSFFSAVSWNQHFLLLPP
jgi:FkbM family methyltransferase